MAENEKRLSVSAYQVSAAVRDVTNGRYCERVTTDAAITALNQRIDGLPTGGGNPYTLPVATASTLGGVQPVAKTSAMTQEVGVDSTGRLYTAPSSGVGAGGADGFSPTATDCITPEMYGAAADGVTDDTEALQAAVNAAAEEKKLLIFAPKTYRITSGITIPTTGTEKGFHMEGFDSEQTVIMADGGFVAFSADSFKRSSAKHMKIVFPDTCPPDAVGFRLGTEGESNLGSYRGLISDIVVTGGSGVDVLRGGYLEIERLGVFYGANQYGVRLTHEYVYMRNCYLSGEKEKAFTSVGTGRAIWLRNASQIYIESCDCCAGRGYGLYLDGDYQQCNIYVDKTTFFGTFISIYANVSHSIENVQITRCDMWSSRKMGPVFMFDRQSDSSVIGMMNFHADISMRGVSNYPGSVAQISDALGSYTSLGKFLEQVELVVKTPNNATVIGYDRRLLLKVNPNNVYYSKPYISVDNDYTAVVLTYYGLFPKYRTNTLYPGYCVQNDDGTMPSDVEFYWQEDGNVTKLMCKGSTTKSFDLTTKIDWDTLANATATAPEASGGGGGAATPSSGNIYSIAANATRNGIPLTNGMQIVVWPSNTGTVELYMAGASTKVSATFTSTTQAAIFVWIATTSTAGSLINLVDGSRTYITFTAGADTVFNAVNGINGNIVVATKG